MDLMNNEAQPDSNIIYWLWLSLACGAGSSVPELLFKKFGPNPQRIYDAVPEELDELTREKGMRPNIYSALVNKSLEIPFKILNWCSENGVGLLPYDSIYFPESLRIIRRSPLLLYYLGNVPDINKRLSIAMVGTRKVSDYGARNAYTIATDLASAGAVIVSGMALGVDGVAHRAAIDSGTYTIAVLGCGIDRVYPREHTNLMREIIMNGTVLTEYCPGTAPIGSNFPVRNRIISCISQGTVVIEADRKSGSLITARYAKEQGKPIFALPGNVGSLGSSGTNQLLKDGAKIITDAFDILDGYLESYSSAICIDNVMNKLEKFRSSYDFRNVFRSKTLPVYPKTEGSKISKGKKASGRTESNKINTNKTKTEDEKNIFQSTIYTGEYECEEKDKQSDEQYAETTARRTGKKNAKENTDSKDDKIENEDKEKAYGDKSKMPELYGNEKEIYLKIPEDGVITYDELVRCGFERGNLMCALTELELKGLIISGRGGEYRRSGFEKNPV